MGTKGDWDFRISDLIKNPNGTNINPCGEFRWSPEGLVSEINFPHIHVGAPGIFSDLLKSVQMLKREWGTESKGSYRTYWIPGKLQPWFKNRPVVWVVRPLVCPY